MKLQFLCGLPGVGKVMEKRLIDRFGSIDSVFRASMEELLELESMGDKTMRKIKEYIEVEKVNSIQE